MSYFPTAIPSSPLAFGSTAMTTVYPAATTTVVPAATTVAYPAATTVAPAGFGYGPGMYGAAPMAPASGFMARHHQKKAIKEHEKAYRELGKGDSADYYKHQSRAARHEYKLNRKAFQNAPTGMGGYGAPMMAPPLPHPGVTTYDAAPVGYSATLYPAFNDFTYGGGYSYDYPAFAAPTSPYGAYTGGTTWF